MLSRHFEVGQWVVLNRKRYEIFAYNGSKVVLISVDETGPVQVIEPYYLQRS